VIGAPLDDCPGSEELVAEDRARIIKGGFCDSFEHESRHQGRGGQERRSSRAQGFAASVGPDLQGGRPDQRGTHLTRSADPRRSKG
jgi:hypothetical protein